MLSSEARSSIAGAGGAPPTNSFNGCPARWASGAPMSMVTTVGAPHMWVTSPVPMMDQISGGSTRSRQRWVAPAAVTAQV